MGSNRWDAATWSGYSAKTQAQTQQQIFRQSGIHPDLDPRNITVRESCDSAANPQSTPIIIITDVTGSMGMLAEQIVKKSLGIIMKEIYDRKPVTDPHVLIGAVGDSKCDQAPFQVTQFEADISLAEQTEKIFIEGNGGGNGGESYLLAWYFAAMKTRCDAQIKRGRKGYIFTIGDEAPHADALQHEIKAVFGDDTERGYTAKELLAMASPNWEVFHLKVHSDRDNRDRRWADLLGERALEITDVDKLGEVIVSTIQVVEGADAAQVASSWSGDTSLVVQKAVGGLVKTPGAGVHRF